MSAAMENLRNDVHKPPEQLEREADSARSAVEGTLAELEQRLSPGEMLDRVTDMVKRNGGEFGENLLAQVRNNPLPTIIAGIGVAWLMAASKRPPGRSRNGQHAWRGGQSADGGADIDSTERWSSAAASASDTASSAADSVKNAVNDAVDVTTDTARRAAAATSQAAQRAADATRQAASRVADTSRSSMRSVAEGYSHLCREQPFVLGAIAVAVGAALGALLPSTATEDELIGETSDAAKERVKSEARARAGDIRDAAMDAIEAVEQESASAVSEPESGKVDTQETTGGPRSDDDV